MVTQLERLAKPFPSRLIHDNPSGGGSYVKHSVVTEKLLAVLGPFSFELVEVIRGHVDAIPPNPQGRSEKAKRGSPALDGCVVGAVCRLSASVDDVPVRVEEVGDCESPHNWPHDGARLKDAMSDALKRAAMRLGVTLHLWSGSEFSLYEQLREQNANKKGAGADSASRDGDAGSASDGADSHDVGRAADEPAPTVLEVGTAPDTSVSPPREPVPAEGQDTASSPSAQSRVESAPGGEGHTSSATSDVDAPSPASASLPTSKNQLGHLRSRVSALISAGVKVADKRTGRGLPKLTDLCTPEDLENWSTFLDELEVTVPVPQ